MIFEAFLTGGEDLFMLLYLLCWAVANPTVWDILLMFISV